MKLSHPKPWIALIGCALSVCATAGAAGGSPSGPFDRGTDAWRHVARSVPARLPEARTAADWAHLVSERWRPGRERLQRFPRLREHLRPPLPRTELPARRDLPLIARYSVPARWIVPQLGEVRILPAGPGVPIGTGGGHW